MTTGESLSPFGYSGKQRSDLFKNLKTNKSKIKIKLTVNSPTESTLDPPFGEIQEIWISFITLQNDKLI